MVTLGAVPVSSAAPVLWTEPPPPGAALVSSRRDASWARAFPKAAAFRELEAPARRSLLIEWRLGPAHAVHYDGSDDEYEGPPAIPIELGVGPASLALGEHTGTVTPASQSYCFDLGWHAEEPQTPRPSSVVSSLSVTTMQGDSDFMIVRDGMTLHVLTRETSDGRCDEAKQGPLDVCEGFEWQRIAAIHLTSDATLYERVESEGKPFDCGAPLPYFDKRLSPP